MQAGDTTFCDQWTEDELTEQAGRGGHEVRTWIAGFYGSIASTGLGAACLGHPFNALQWLARKMAALGRPLDEGDIVLSGALGPMVPVEAGDVFTVEIQGFSPLHLSFSA